AILQFRAAQIGDADIKQDASRLGFVRQTIEQLLRRRVSRNRVTGLLQAPFDRAPEGSIVIDDMNDTRQFLSPNASPVAARHETPHRLLFGSPTRSSPC